MELHRSEAHRQEKNPVNATFMVLFAFFEEPYLHQAPGPRTPHPRSFTLGTRAWRSVRFVTGKNQQLYCR